MQSTVANKIATRQAYGEALCEIGGERQDVVVLDADLSGSTKTSLFRDKYPSRFFNAGIAEMNLVGMAAGLASCGLTPFVSTFAAFGAGRAYDALRSLVCYPGLNVKIACTHAGLTVGEDGATHQMLEDIALMNALPNMAVLVPADAAEAREMVRYAAQAKGPCYIRLGREPSDQIYDSSYRLDPSGGVDIIRDGQDCAIVACGAMVAEALRAARLLAEENVDCAVLNFSMIKPFDPFNLIAYAKKARAVVTCEEHTLKGGLHSIVSSVLAEYCPTYCLGVGVQDVFGQSGKPEELFSAYGLSPEAIKAKVREALRKAL
jgi:transketolase